MKKLFKLLSVLMTVAFLFISMTACEITTSDDDDDDPVVNYYDLIFSVDDDISDEADVFVYLIDVLDNCEDAQSVYIYSGSGTTDTNGFVDISILNVKEGDYITCSYIDYNDSGDLDNSDRVDDISITVDSDETFTIDTYDYLTK